MIIERSFTFERSSLLVRVREQIVARVRRVAGAHGGCADAFHLGVIREEYDFRFQGQNHHEKICASDVGCET